MHAMLGIGDSTDIGENSRVAIGPLTLKGTPVTLHLYVKDVDSARASSASSAVTLPQDMLGRAA